MMTTLTEWRDRAGHGASAAALVLLALVVSPETAAAQRPGNYDASRFDVAIQVLEGGDVEVRETIAFRFESGTFRRVWREIPTSRTDGIQVIEASMDGTPTPPGDGPGSVTITGRNRVKIEWRFDPVGPSSHTFALRYRARGAVYRDAAHDVVRWRLLPSEHKYRIVESRSTITAPSSIAAEPKIETHRIASASHERQDGTVAIAVFNVDRNGWAIAELRYPAGDLIATLPGWQQRHQHASALAPRWSAAATGVFAVCVVLLLSIRQRYPRPSVVEEEATTTEPPEPLPGALAAALVARGGSSPYLSSATIFDLAERGVLAVRELPRSFGVRAYELAQVPGRYDLDDHEQEALTIAFVGRPDAVTISKARARLARSSRRFTAAVTRDLAARGYLDPDRQAIRQRLMGTSVVLLVAAAVLALATAPWIPRFEGWPFLLSLALCAAGIIGVIIAVNTAPLSDQGFVEAARWRGFRRYLKSAVAAKHSGAVSALSPRWVVYGIAVGLASQWARYLKANPGAAPAWFQTATPDDRGAFAAFIGSHAGASGGSAGAGGAAGGGGSGAG